MGRLSGGDRDWSPTSCGPAGPGMHPQSEVDADCRRPMSLVRVLALAGILIALTGFGMLSYPESARFLWVVQLILLLTAAGMVASGCATVQRYLREPLDMVARWATQVHTGNLAARVPEPQHPEFVPLARNINELSDRLQEISDGIEMQVEQQTQRLERKTGSLQLMYDVAASINMSGDVRELLRRFLDVLAELTQARAATARLRTEDNQMELVASIGLDESDEAAMPLLPMHRCIFGEVIIPVSDQLWEEFSPTPGEEAPALKSSRPVKLVAVPLVFQGRTQGLYSLFIEDETLIEREDIRELLTSIGRHLGMAIERARLDLHRELLSRMEERTHMAHELHDSLAQTLASIRLQVRVLDQSLHEGNESAVWQEMELLENSIDEGYTEVRELIAHFRAPINNGGLIPGIEEAVNRLRKVTGIRVFFQNEWPDPELPAEVEMQTLRIIQEALTNIRKHAEANMVRVILHSDPDNGEWALIEDDGVGFESVDTPGCAGEHIGLTIMRERAERIGAEFSVESEVGEGTRLVLRFGARPLIAEAV